MLRKGALESGLGEIILTVLVAAVISGAMFGPLGAKVGEGFKEAEKFTDVTTQVTVSDSDTLGDLAQYSFWRAWGCDKVSGETFPGLTSTNLTDDGQVPCAGAGGTVAAGVRNLYSNTGNDMEGKYSRVNFVVNETITLKTGEGFGPDDGKSAVLLGVSTGDNGKAGYSDWIWSGCTAYDAGVSDDYMRGEDWESQGPPYSYHTLFFKNGGGTDRISRYGNGATIEDRYDSGGQNDPLYCNQWNEVGSWLTKPSSKTGNPKDHDSTGDSYVEVKLCPGDKGYVETRKGYPNVAGESTGSIGSNNNDALYGMIQITQMNSSCSGVPEPEVEQYQGPDSAKQIYFRGKRGAYPDNIDLFEFRTEGNYKTGHESAGWMTRDICQIRVTEKDTAINDQGWASFGPSTLIERDGSLPNLDDARGRNIQNGPTYDEKGYYQDINFQGNSMNDGAELFLQAGGYKNELVGDILCGYPEGSDIAEWHVCHEGVDGKKVTAYGGEWACDGGSGDWQNQQTVPNPRSITTQYDFFVPEDEEEQVLQEQPEGLVFTPSQSDQWDKIFYQNPVPTEPKRISVTLEFAQKGHLKVDYEDYSGYSDTRDDPAGSDDNPNPYFLMEGDGSVSLVNSQVNQENVYTYNTGQEFTLEMVQRSPFFHDGDSDLNNMETEAIYRVKVGGSTVWESGIDDHTAIHDQIQIESWNNYPTAESPETDKPVVAINDITVERLN